MTNREFYKAVIEAGISDELSTFATEAIAKLDTKNAKRSGTPSKNAIANAPYRAEVLAILEGADKPLRADEILAMLDHEGFTVNKVNGLVGTLVKEGKVSKALETGVAKSKAKVVYSIVAD